MDADELQGIPNLEARRVMDLDHPVPTVLAEVDFSGKEASGKYVCKQPKGKFNKA